MHNEHVWAFSMSESEWSWVCLAKEVKVYLCGELEECRTFVEIAVCVD